MLNTSVCIRNAQNALRQGAKIALAYFDRPDRIELSPDQNWLSNTHREVYTAIAASLTTAYPEHAFYPVNESPKADSTQSHIWVIDPLDGFDNFTTGIGLFALTAVLYIHGKPTISIIYAPIMDEIFTAVLGSGAQVNGKRIRTQKGMQNSMLSACLYNTEKIHADLSTVIPPAILQTPCRNLGCLSLSLAYHASGRFLFLLASDFNKPSVTAAHLLAIEAGSVGKYFTLKESDTLCCLFSAPGLLPKSFYQSIKNG